MKLLLDANLSWRLTNKLKIFFTECLHVDSIDIISPAKDMEIWNYAKLNGFIIVTNDEDFLNLSNVNGFPPKVILLRTGNQRNVFIEELINRHKPDIESLSLSPETGVLEIFSS